MKLTPWTKRIALVCITACFFVSIICRESQIAGTIVGGLLLLINPEEK